MILRIKRASLWKLTCQFRSAPIFSVLPIWNNPLMLKNFSHFNLRLTLSPIFYGRAQNQQFVSTDNRSLTRFFQAKTLPSSLWSCVDHVLNFNFFLGLLPVKANLAADCFYRIDLKPDTKPELKYSSRLPNIELDFNLALESPDNSVNVAIR